MINVKKQTKRATEWLPYFAENINVFYNEGKFGNQSFQFAIITSKHWGDFSEMNIKDPLIEITIDDKNYRMNLSKFKEIIKNNND